MPGVSMPTMELTPKVFRDVQFREKLRGGYHPEDVDEFLEQAAVATEALLERARQASERAQRAEQAATDATATDEALKRMLLMAQKTADQAVREAREEADRHRADARRQADALIVDAEERGRRAYESAIAEGRAMLGRLDDAVKQRQSEVEALKAWVDMHKAHLLTALRDAQAMVESAGLVSEPPAAGMPPGATVAAAPAVKVEQPPADVAEAELDRTGPVLPEQEPAVPVEVQQPSTPSPTGADEVPPATAGAPSLFEGGGAETEGEPLPVDNGQWGSRYLDELHAAREEAGQTEPAAGGPAPSAVGAPPEAHGQPEHQAAAGQGGEEGGDTVAFDERALDSFFSDQDLGDDRGLGRFRRRQ